MVAYLADMIQAFGPPAIVFGLAAPLGRRPPSSSLIRVYALAAIVGLTAGGVVHHLAQVQGFSVATRTGMHLVALGVMPLAAFALALGYVGRNRSGFLLDFLAPLLIVVFSARGAFAFAGAVADRSLTATSVLNTELILNLAAMMAGTLAIAGLAAVVLRSATAASRAAGWTLAGILGLESGVSAAISLLGLLQLQAIEVTSARISFVARVGALAPYAVYAELLAVGLLAVVAFARKRTAETTGSGVVNRRKARAVRLTRRRWLGGAAATASFLIAILLYHDLYASQPPSLSPAAPAQPDGGGRVRIDVETVKDGRLHRYAYVTSDGHRVRFFLINRYDADHVKIGVVFDACMICGDDGYIQVGNEVICIACNVRIFVPSIGKAGGCNPIPLPHIVDGGTIAIAAADLEKGAKYFSEVVAIAVEDPVTGAPLINTEAPFRYEFKGRTFFFEDRDSYERFRAAPEDFAGDLASRPYRVQGHQES